MNTVGLRMSALLALLLAGVGCIQMEHELRIKADGSAEYRLDYAISEQAVMQFRMLSKIKKDLALAAGEADPGPELEPLLNLFLDPDEAALRTQLEPYAARGVVIRTLRQQVRAAWRHVELQLEIADLAALAEDPFFREHGFALYPDEAGRQVWSRAPHLDDTGALLKTPSPAELDQISPILSGFKTIVKVTVPGRILSTTAPRTTLQTASWEFDFNRQPTEVQSLLRQSFHVLFEAPSGASLPVLNPPAARTPPAPAGTQGGPAAR